MSPVVIFAVVGGLGSLLALVTLVKYLRGPKEDRILHFVCTKCGSRLRYSSRQVGHKGKCRRCNADLLFPHPSKAVD